MLPTTAEALGSALLEYTDILFDRGSPMNDAKVTLASWRRLGHLRECDEVSWAPGRRGHREVGHRCLSRSSAAWWRR